MENFISNIDFLRLRRGCRCKNDEPSVSAENLILLGSGRSGQKSMHFPATNKFLMTAPCRVYTTHPEMEYLRLVASPWRLRVGKWKYLLASRTYFHPLSLWKVSPTKPQNCISISSAAKIDLFILVGNIRNWGTSRARERAIRINSTFTFIPLYISIHNRE